MPASASLTPAPLLFSPSAQREGSMPSSPTSVHSSTSAIFERDIQLPIQHSPHKDPHRTARAVNHEPIESAVPSVLTAAIEALGDDNGRPQALEDISVLAPSHPRTLVSRSPSPQLRHRPADSIQTPLAVNSNSPRQPPSPSIVPPTPNVNSFGFSPLTTGSPSSAPSSPPTSNSPLTPPVQPNSPSHARIRQGGSASASPSRPTSLVALSLEELSLSPLVCTTADLPVPVPPESTPIATSGLTASSHASSTNAPPSPSLKASKRLSFVSYNDLLNSTPVSAFTLAAATHPSIEDEPPHLVGGGGHSKAPSVRGSPTNDNFVTATTQSTPAIHAHDLGAKGGGEWQREGLGTSLEERLEAVLKEPAVSGSK